MKFVQKNISRQNYWKGWYTFSKKLQKSKNDWKNIVFSKLYLDTFHNKPPGKPWDLHICPSDLKFSVIYIFFFKSWKVPSRLGSRSRSRSWSRSEPGVFGSLEPEPLEKKHGARAAWKKSQEPEPKPLKI